jgi:hypothetical protein
MPLDRQLTWQASRDDDLQTLLSEHHRASHHPCFFSTFRRQRSISPVLGTSPSRQRQLARGWGDPLNDWHRQEVYLSMGPIFPRLLVIRGLTSIERPIFATSTQSWFLSSARLRQLGAALRLWMIQKTKS